MLERKFYAERVRRFVVRMESALFDSYRRMDEEREARGLPHPLPEEVNLLSWPQTWPDSSHGFPEPGRPDESPTTQTHVVTDEELCRVYVYHDGRFVRRIEDPGEPFWRAVRIRRLPGATDSVAWEALGAE